MKKKVLAAILTVVTAVTCIPCNIENVSAAENIPAGAKSYQGHYYYVYEDADSWEDAKAKCESRGGHLATITSKEEDDAVYQCAIDSGHRSLWFGLYKDKEGNWKWVTGEKVSYLNWDTSYGQPEESPTEVIAGYYDRGQPGKWHDINDYDKIGVYICEWEGYTINLNEKSLVMKPGTSEYLEYSATKPDGTPANKAAIWKSSNVKVAKVSSKGKVVAVNPGSCTITCKVGTGAKTVKVVVLPRKVTKLSTLTKTKNSVQLKWKRQAGVKGFVVYMYDSDLEEYTKVKTVKGTFQTALVRNLKSGRTYRFKVRAYVKSGSKNYYGDYSKVYKVKTKK